MRLSESSICSLMEIFRVLSSVKVLQLLFARFVMAFEINASCVY